MAADAWSEELKNGVCRVTDLLALLQLDAQAVDADLDPEFPLRVPRAFVRRMRRGDPRDPLLLQVLPRREERRAVAGFVSDPLQEGAAVLAGGVLQKYAGRVLLLAAGRILLKQLRGLFVGERVLAGAVLVAIGVI